MWVGDRLDRWLGSGPLLALLGMLLGAAAGFYRLYVHMVVLPRRDAESHPGEGRKGT
jgi:F0F1-type ATP synthase assembly protein I